MYYIVQRPIIIVYSNTEHKGVGNATHLFAFL